MTPTTVRAASANDAAAIADIYNHYIASSVITFEEETVTPAELEQRIAAVQAASLPWLVAEESGKITGYAYATAWKPRSAYRFSVEITVYIAPTHAGRGIGSRLYSELLPILRARQIHAIMGSIALPNDASIALHEKFAFRKVAHFHQVGFKFDRWIDVGYWELTLQ